MHLSSRTSLLALVCLLGALAVSLVSRRKTIGFGPVYPHARSHDKSNPYWVARGFVTALLKDQPSGYNSFALRKSSYTDNATGVTHVFFRQMIKGIQVLDGDINVSVKGGVVISRVDSVSILVKLPWRHEWRSFYQPVLPWEFA
jgi:extracellular elastinolytic metalloproteinase